MTNQHIDLTSQHRHIKGRHYDRSQSSDRAMPP